MPRRAPLEARVGRPARRGEVVDEELGLLVLQEVQRQRPRPSARRTTTAPSSVSSLVRKLSMNSSGSRTSCCSRSASTCRAMTSRKVSPSRTSSSDLARSRPIDVPSPPLSLMTTVRREGVRGDVVGDVDVGERLHVERLDGALGHHAGLAGLDEAVVVREHLDRHRVDALGRHLVARLLQSLVAHGPDRRVTDRGRPPATRGLGARPGAAQKTALRDQLSRPRVAGSAARARARTPRRSPSTCSPPTSVRRAATVAAYVSVGHRAGDRAAARGARARPGKRVILPVLLPDVDLDWAVHTGRPRTRPAAGCSSPTDRPLGLDAIATADVVLAPGLAVDRDGHADGHAAAAPTTGRSGGCRSAPSCASLLLRRRGRRPGPAGRRTTGRSPRRVTPCGIWSAAPDGLRVSGSSAASSTAVRVNAHGAGPPVGPQVGLVGVVAAEGVPARAGEVHPRRVVEVGQRDDHPHRRHPVDLVALAGVPADRVDDAGAAAELPRRRG